MKQIISFFAVTFLFGCAMVATKSKDSPRTPSQIYNQVPRDGADAWYTNQTADYRKTAKIASNQHLSFSIFQTLIEDKKFKSVDESLPTLAARYPEFLRFHTLMYYSQSIQGSTFEEPRAIVFGPDARFIFTFNGGPPHDGGSEFETAEYQQKAHTFLYREIIFKSANFDREKTRLKDYEIAFENENILVSTANPGKCADCHGSGNPIWASYSIWPGAFGSNDDLLFMSVAKESWNENNRKMFEASDRPQSQGESLELNAGHADNEVKGLIAYLRNKPNHPRYKWLPEQFYEQSFLRFAAGEAFSKIDASEKALAERTKFDGSTQWPTRPNFYFQQKLMMLNQDRMLAKLSGLGMKKAFESPAWEFYLENVKKIDPAATIQGLADLAQKTLGYFEFKGQRPTRVEIEKTLRQDLSEEMEMQVDKIYFLEGDLGKDSIRLKRPYDDMMTRFGILWPGDTIPFYKQLMDWKKVDPVEEIACYTETDSQGFLTILNFLLRDRGFDLHDYSMSRLGGKSYLTFVEDGLVDVLEFLGAYVGIPKPPN